MERTVSAAGDGVLRLAMWSGPRNISTAFMRSWENRGDTIVIDEPFYAHYLKVTGLDHPGRDEIIAHQESDWRRVAGALLAPMPPDIRVFYQKQMSHHLLPHMGREWLDSVTHAFLIRDPPRCWRRSARSSRASTCWPRACRSRSRSSST